MFYCYLNKDCTLVAFLRCSHGGCMENATKIFLHCNEIWSRPRHTENEFYRIGRYSLERNYDVIKVLHECLY
jgi:hypothetical protein